MNNCHTSINIPGPFCSALSHIACFAKSRPLYHFFIDCSQRWSPRVWSACSCMNKPPAERAATPSLPDLTANALVSAGAQAIRLSR